MVSLYSCTLAATPPSLCRSCDNEEVIELVPVHTDYTLQCGTRLEIRILPKTADPKGPVTLKIFAENVDMENYEAAAQSVIFSVVIVPVAKLEVRLSFSSSYLPG